mmetsp:Transcript_74789/g.161770  ORF Transcript_74789/g.161770 Transcript_74789/m.161770 type:complete len:265 (+) Transcript_74789:105-899(+)
MANEEEQALEIEALQSIFEEGKEFVSISPTEFLLTLVPYPAGEEENHVGVTLHVTYTPEYPETLPEWELQDVKGFNDEKTDALKEKIEEIANSSVGMVMVYSMAEACQDYLKENNEKSLSMHEEMLKRQAAENPEEEEDEEEEDEDEDENVAEQEWKGLAEKELPKEDDRITEADFLAWKEKFDAELVASGVLKRDTMAVKTGKMIFCEANGAPKDGKEGAATGGYPGEAAKGDASAPAVYNAALFGEEDDADLDDLDDLDEED